jgi:voltage-gated potassium channel
VGRVNATDRPPSALRVIVKKLRWAVLIAAALIVFSTTGYWLLEDYGWLEAFYMTIITLATVGYGEVQPLSAAGRLFTIAVIVAGFGVFVYVTSQLTTLMLSGEITSVIRVRRRVKMRERLEGHVIVVGYGRVGRSTVRAIREAGLPCAVVERSTTLEDEITEIGAVLIEGDGRDIDTLQAAGIDRSIALATVLDDPDNLVVIVTARTLSPDLRIVSRVNDDHWCERLVHAGASQLVPVYESAGTNIATTALSANVIAVQDLVGMGMRTEEILVPKGSSIAGSALMDLMAGDDDLVLVGIRRENNLTRWHEVEGPLSEGDIVLAMGPRPSLDRLASRMKAGTRQA